MRLFLVITVVFAFGMGIALAQTDAQQQTETKELKKNYLYQWMDDKGVTHVTDNLGKVPQKYRNKARQIEESTENETPAPEQQKITKPSIGGSEEDREQERKADWQQRMKEARQRLANAERRYQEASKQREEALAKRAGGDVGNIGIKLEEANRLEEEMKNLQKVIDDTRNEIENVIPEEARRAGVPPGWIRE
jgi:hypothetical protein